MSNEFIANHESDFAESMEHYKKELNGLRVGRANPAMVENVMVEAYGVRTPVTQLANITVPEPRSLTIEPWDKNLLKEVEKALSQANLGFSVKGESTLVRATLPQMTEEGRVNLVKLLTGKMEDAKISIRGVREKVKDEITDAFKDSLVTEDDKYAYIEELEKKVGELNKQIIELAEKKEKEIMTV